MQYVNVGTNISAPLKAVTTDASGNTDTNTASGTKTLFYPTVGMALGSELGHHFRWEIRGSGFGLPHRGNIWDAQATIAFRVGPIEILGGEKGGRAIVLGCLAPPPFPFTLVVATTNALGYPRKKLLATVAAARAARFLILGYLAIRFGRHILRIADSEPFRWTMIVFVVLCIAGSALSIAKWVRRK